MKHLRHAHVSALAALLAPLPALAQDALPPPQDASACASIAADQPRLACYDAAFRARQSLPAVQQADAAAAEAREQLQAQKELAKSQEKKDDDDKAAGKRELYANDPARRALANAGKGSLLDSRWELAKDSKLGVFNLRAYKPLYLLPAYWSSRPNKMPSSPNPANTVTMPQDLKSVEAKYQISLKTKVVQNLFGDNGDIWAAYTQTSHWQVYSPEISRPFRETNYEPEVMLVFRNSYKLGGWNGRMASIGVNHQSNGRADPLSRSWNRVVASIGLDRENWALTVRPWYRIPESWSDDNNPDISDYMGRADLLLVHTRGQQEFSLLARHSLRSGDRSHGAVQFDWGFPLTHQLRGHVQVFDGYGESMIDYNHRATYIGLGVSLLEWF
ncbi:MAG: phospholipase A [Xanthomonadaceae bacterium]|nr:phospholipase A [Xanthomonadaceae bacterium]